MHILSREKSVCDVRLYTTAFKEQSSSKASRLEKALLNWICNKIATGVQIGGAMVRELAERLSTEASKTLPSCEKLHLTFINE